MKLRSITNLLTLLLALAGCFVAIVLTYEEFHPKADIGCSKFGGDCEKTISSKYGHLGPIPTSIIGLGMYLTLAGTLRHAVQRHSGCTPSGTGEPRIRSARYRTRTRIPVRARRLTWRSWQHRHPPAQAVAHSHPIQAQPARTRRSQSERSIAPRR